MSVSRILIVGDVLRPHTADPSRSEAVTRTRWLHDLLAPPLALATDLPVDCLTADAPPLRFRQLYKDCGLEPSVDAWAALYGGELAPALSRRFLSACRDALVIGMELPPSIARLLARAGIPALECSVHPLRFLDDIPLGWRATATGVSDALSEFAVSDFEVRQRAARIRAKMRWLGGPSIEPATTLVLDQLDSDAAMVDPHAGRRVSWSDYLDQVVALREAGPVIWRPHPYSPERSPLLDVLGPARMTDANFYALLSLDNLATVSAISSGGVVEARAFGKAGVHLLDRDAGFDRQGWSAPVPVVGHWLSPHFWSAVLAPLVATNPDVPRVAPERDALRRANNTDWDFGWIDQVVERQSARARFDADIAQRLAVAERRGEELARQLRDVTVEAAALRQRADAADVSLARLGGANRYRVRAVIDELVQHARRERWRVGVLGAGSHTEWLLRETRLGNISALVIFDANARMQGRRLGRRTVWPAHAIPEKHLDAIVVSSLAYEDEMVAYLESLSMPGTRIVRCYR